MPVSEIISIGTELILGDIADTNSGHIAQMLKNIGIDVKRITIIPDDQVQITEVFEKAIKRSEIIISTGGLGPTIDDPTRDAVANATNCELIFQPLLWEQILKKYKQYGKTPTDNNKKQAYIPYGAEPIENPKGTAPAFSITNDLYLVICLPGVPEEMKYLLEKSVIPMILNRFGQLEKTITKVLHISGLGESKIDELIAPFEKSLNPKVGLLAHPGRTDIRITAKAKTMEKANSIINETIDSLYKILNDNIYGEDNQSLESVVLEKLVSDSLHIRLVHNNLNYAILAPITKTKNISLIESDTENLTNDTFDQIKDLNSITLFVGFSKDTDRYILTITTYSNGKKTLKKRFFAGPEKLSSQWAKNAILDHIRRLETN